MLTESLDAAVRDYLRELKHSETVAKRGLAKAPEGSLRISVSKTGVPRFYHYYLDDEGNHVDKYLSKKKNFKLIQALARKGYYEELVSHSERETKNTLKAYERLVGTSPSSVYNGLSSMRKELVSPVKSLKDIEVEKFEEEKIQANSYFDEKLIYKTNRGEMVRSKSELIIANALYAHRDELLYKYERPIGSENGMNIAVPDFTVMRKRDAKLTYWEHAGMLDDAAYADGYVRKTNRYISMGIIPGENVVFSMETSSVPLDTETVERIIEHYFL